jgi:hypothetical protein
MFQYGATLWLNAVIDITRTKPALEKSGGRERIGARHSQVLPRCENVIQITEHDVDRIQY